MLDQFAEKIRNAAAQGRPLRIRGSGTKDFYGVALEGDALDTRGFSGIVDYEPSELVLTARAGTPLADVEKALCERGQMLACEPPYFSSDGTLGGCVAAGFSGPRRAYSGSVRDFVLGTQVMNGDGEVLNFGGRVMKNVAGYDVSRAMAGSFGTLGLILEVSLKVLPLPQKEVSLRFDMSEADAIAAMNRWAGQPLPISATCFFSRQLTVRLSGAEPAVNAAVTKLGGESVMDAATFWRSIRDQHHKFFAATTTLWRFSIKPTAPPLELGQQLMEWNGSLRWISTTIDAESLHRAARSFGGHATLFRAAKKTGDIQRLEAHLLELHKRLKSSLDPAGIFGPHRIHTAF